MYLLPPDPKSLGPVAVNNEINAEPDTEAALKLLQSMLVRLKQPRYVQQHVIIQPV